MEAAGSTAAGVKAGTAAAAARAEIGNVAAGSTFAGLQSVGAGGAAAGLFGLLQKLLGWGFCLGFDRCDVRKAFSGSWVFV
ncbi:hypothetical protein C369_07400 [Cryptococcus neoformans A5-35-17]|nr:hypothetical protein C369_07400 [Cryptococcus neoformans var. grubii A5-35-17]